jgi:hypothetical protein
MFKKLFFTTVISLMLFPISFATKAYAQMDISLIDNKEEGLLTILVDSAYNVVAGINMSVIFSDNVVVNEINKTEDYCSLRFNSEITHNKFSVECFNESPQYITDKIATVSYTKTSDDYFFYVDLETLDVGNVPIKDIHNINKPEDVKYDIEAHVPAMTKEQEETETKTVVDFLKENRLYILGAGVLLLLLSLIIIKTSSSKKTSEENSQDDDSR